MKTSELITELVNILAEYGDIECYINTNDNAIEVSPLNKNHIKGGSACICLEEEHGMDILDDSEPILYLGD